MKKIVVVLGSICLLLVTWFSFQYFTKKTGPKLILLGLDGADWDIIDHYIEAGKLPNFKRLKEEGTWGYLSSLEPTLSPMLWTTIATGKRPDQHGIVDFLEWDEEKKERLPVTSNHRKVPALWNILSHHKLKVGVFNWLVSWPAEKVKGVIVSDRLGYHVFPHIIGPRLTLEKVSYPVDYAEKKKNLFTPPENITYSELSKFISLSEEEFKQQNLIGEYDAQNPDMFLRLTLSSFKTFQNFAFDYWKNEKPDFLALYFDIPDSLMHTFMDYSPPKLSRVSSVQFKKYQNAVSMTYEKLDHFISEILSQLDSKTHFMIVSDHGFKFGKERLKVSSSIGGDNEVKWHDKEGIVLFWGEQFQTKKQILGMSLYDIVPTILKFFNLPQAQDMSGTIISSAFKATAFNTEEIKTVASYDSIPFGSGRLIQERNLEADQHMKEKLASLGYIQPEEEKNKNSRFQTRNPFLEAVHLQKAGRDDEAISLYLTILEKEPNTKDAVSIYNSLSLMYRYKKDYQKAKDYIQKAIQREKKEKGENLSDLYINLGNLEKQFGYLTKAFLAYKTAEQINPKNGMVDYAIGLFFEEQKKWGQAEIAFRSALAKKGEIEWLPHKLIISLEKQHKTQELKKMYEQFSLQKSPQKRFQFFIGEASRYLEQNRFKESLEAYFNALQLQPKNAIIYNDIGGVFLKQNNKEKAIAYFKRAQELDPGSHLPYLNLSSAYLEMGQLNQAQGTLEKVLKMDSNNKHAYFLMGIVQQQLKRYNLAKSHFKKALELDPHFFQASQQLKFLENNLMVN